MGSFIMPLLALILTQKLGLTKTQAGNFSFMLIASQAPCLILGGKLIDTVGRKKVLVIFQSAGAFFYLLCAFVPNSAMIICIVIAANLYVIASPSFDAIMADLTVPENRQSAFSLIYLGINIGMTISPLLGGFLFKSHLHLLFLLDAVTTLACTIIIGLTIHEPDFRQPILQQENGAEPAKEASVLQVLKATPFLAGFIILMFCYDFTYSQWNFMMPLQLGDLFGEKGAPFYSYLNALNAFTVIVFTPLVTRLTRRFRPLAVIGSGAALYFAAFLAFSMIRSLPFYFIFAVLFTFGEILVTINIGSFVANHSPSAYRGRINSIRMFESGFASAMGPLIMGYAVTALDYTVSWILIAAVILLGGIGMLALNRKEVKSQPIADQQPAV